VVRWLICVLVLFTARVASAAPPSGYSCGEGGKVIKDQGCQCPQGKTPARDAENTAVCVKKAEPKPVEPEALTAPTACMKDRKGKHTLKIDSAPQGATVYIGDKACGVVGYTPWAGLINAGAALVLVEKDGFAPTTRNVDGKAKEVFFALTKVSASIAIGWKEDKNIEGADAFIDGLPVGKAPMVKIVTPGRHLVELKKPGFAPFAEWVEAPDGKRTTINPTLNPLAVEPATAIVRVLSDTPGARAWLDGVDMGPVPVDIKDIKPGEHIVGVKAPGYPSKEEAITLVAGQRVTRKFDLVAPVATGMLKIVAMNAGAEVFVDGAALGKVPVQKVVPVGEHFIVVKLAGHKNFEQRVRVEAGVTITVQAFLKELGK
jgi:hypothetical protein